MFMKHFVRRYKKWNKIIYIKLLVKIKDILNILYRKMLKTLSIRKT